jgi:hypothetical protein
MKTNNLSDAVKVLLLIGTVIVACILCAIVFKMVNNGKSAVTANTNNLTEMSGQYQDIDLSLYEGSLVPGSEIQNLIKNAVENKDYIAIEITNETSTSTASYNYLYDATAQTLLTTGTQGQIPLKDVPSEKYAVGYINPTGVYMGETLKDKDNDIVCLRFTRQ